VLQERATFRKPVKLVLKHVEDCSWMKMNSNWNELKPIEQYKGEASSDDESVTDNDADDKRSVFSHSNINPLDIDLVRVYLIFVLL